MTTDAAGEQQVRDLVRVGVRAGLLSTEDLHAEVVEAIAAELPDRSADADALAAGWVAEARDRLRVDQEGWPEATDYERLQTAFDELEILDVVVLQGCQDRTVAERALEERTAAGTSPAGIAWFTPSDVWRAVDESRLEVNLWHGTTATVAVGDELLDDVLGILEKHGLSARFDDGRIEVDAHWHKRVAP